MKKNKGNIYQQSGFTLIELLVVIALIGILSAVVLASLNSARIKSNDTAVKAALNQVRTQADLFYTARGTYIGVCLIASDSLVPKGINGMVLSAGKINGYNSLPVNFNYTGSNERVKCNQGSNVWAAEVELKGETGTGPFYYCVDYTGKGIVTTDDLVNTDGSPAGVCS